MVLALTLGGLSPAWAEATVGEVLALCTRALAAGYDGVDAVMCDWYVRPCGVCGADTQPGWCLPAQQSDHALAREVVTWLQAAPAEDMAAKPFIESRLRLSYPCP